MSVYNGEAFLLASVQSVLEQTFGDFEFLVIDDGSTDDSLEILQGIQDGRLRIVRNEENLGLIRSLNKGINLARGEYIARHDCDDLMATERLHHQVSYLDSHSDVVLVGTWMQLIDARDQPIEPWCNPQSDVEIRWASLFNAAVSHPSSMYRTELARALGGYAAESVHAEDFDLWSRMAEHGAVANIPLILEFYRIHGESVSKKHEVKQLQTRYVIASRNIHRVMGDISFEPALMELIIQTRMPVDSYELKQMVLGYQSLAQAFFVKHNVREMLQKKIRMDIVERLSSAFQHVSWQSRIEVLLSCWTSFPMDFWLRGRFLSLVFNDQFKRNIARLLGKA